MKTPFMESPQRPINDEDKIMKMAEEIVRLHALLREKQAEIDLLEEDINKIRQIIG